MTLGTAQPKPANGSARAERVARAKARESYEREQKAAVRTRDGHACRWPGCDWKARRDRIEVAHVINKGMGGDHGRLSSSDQMICLCVAHHQGRPSLHSGDLKIELLTVEGTDGPVLFWRQGEAGWYVVALESAPGVIDRD